MHTMPLKRVTISTYYKLLFVFSFPFSNYTYSMEFSISKQWDGEKIDHDPVILKLSTANEGSVCLEVDAPFFDDPRPAGPGGRPFPQLWDYEGTFIFFIYPKMLQKALY